MKKAYVFLGLALAVLLMGASGDDGQPRQGVIASGYRADTQTVAFRAGLSGTDTLTTAGILATKEFVTLGRPTIAVSARFSNAGATVKVRIAYVYKSSAPLTGSSTDGTNTVKGYSQEFTLTASSTQYEGAYFPAPDQLFDTEGSVTVRVLVTGAVSAGTVDLWAGSF